MLKILRNRAKSFSYAFEGIAYVLRTQPNGRIHGLATVLVVGLGLCLGLPGRDWAILVLAMIAVWVGEFFNTAIEAIVDMTMPDPHPLAKVAKDVAAGAVLITAIGAAIIGLLILGPPLWQIISG